MKYLREPKQSKLFIHYCVKIVTHLFIQYNIVYLQNPHKTHIGKGAGPILLSRIRR